MQKYKIHDNLKCGYNIKYIIGILYFQAIIIKEIFLIAETFGVLTILKS